MELLRDLRGRRIREAGSVPRTRVVNTSEVNRIVGEATDDEDGRRIHPSLEGRRPWRRVVHLPHRAARGDRGVAQGLQTGRNRVEWGQGGREGWRAGKAGEAPSWMRKRSNASGEAVAPPFSFGARTEASPPRLGLEPLQRVRLRELHGRLVHAGGELLREHRC